MGLCGLNRLCSPLTLIPVTNPIKRRTEVVGIFPNDEAIVRMVGALLPEQNDEWAVQRSRYVTLETNEMMSDSFPHQPASSKLTINRSSGMNRGRLSYTTS